MKKREDGGTFCGGKRNPMHRKVKDKGEQWGTRRFLCIEQRQTSLPKQKNQEEGKKKRDQQQKPG